MMDASQARASYAAEAAVTAWRGKAGMLWPIFSGLVLTVLRLGILFWCVGAAMYITAGSAQLWGALLGFAVAAGAVFHAACELLWWRAFTDDAGCLSPRSSLRDLPAMLSIDLIFGCARYFSMTAAACCALSGQVMAAATGALIALVAAILQPAVTAQKLISGRPLAICAREAA
ncbi:MAG: hypothetical protein IKY83_01285, partial [Proteobacteria bacterium]|nr:hypothetical protein [Pseudomonadota bacterium]